MTGLRFKLPPVEAALFGSPAQHSSSTGDQATDIRQGRDRSFSGGRGRAAPTASAAALARWGQTPLNPRAQVRRLLWPLATILTLFGTALLLLAGQTINLPHNALLLLLIGLCAALDRWHARAGSVVFLACLPVFLAWLTLSPGVGQTFITDFAGYSGVLLLPTLLAALLLRGRGLLAFVVHALVVGLVASLPLPAERVLGVLWSTALALCLGGVVCWLLRSLEHTLSSLQSSALLDPLTGLKNRRSFDTALGAAWAERTHTTGLLILDVDDLKGLNDRYGHAAGDEMLRLFGHFVQARLLPGTTAYRLGGDEFAVLCRDSDLAAAREQILLAAQQVSRPDRPAIQVSVGAASSREVRNRAALVRLADERMYAEKRRNNPYRSSSQPGRPRSPTLIERLF